MREENARALCLFRRGERAKTRARGNRREDVDPPSERKANGEERSSQQGKTKAQK